MAERHPTFSGSSSAPRNAYDCRPRIQRCSSAPCKAGSTATPGGATRAGLMGTLSLASVMLAVRERERSAVCEHTSVRLDRYCAQRCLVPASFS